MTKYFCQFVNEKCKYHNPPVLCIFYLLLGWFSLCEALHESTPLQLVSIVYSPHCAQRWCYQLSVWKTLARVQIFFIVYCYFDQTFKRKREHERKQYQNNSIFLLFFILIPLPLLLLLLLLLLFLLLFRLFLFIISIHRSGGLCTAHCLQESCRHAPRHAQSLPFYH